jgi:hypothetical protein
MRKLSLNAGRTGVLCGIFLLQIACGAALAETADTPGSAVAPAAPGEAAKDTGPFGGCEPLGMTASGELVFPLECKRVLHKTGETPVASDDKAGATPAAAEAKPADVKAAAPEDKPAVTLEKAATEEKPAAVETRSAAVEAKPAEASAASNKPAVADKALPAAQEKAAEKAAPRKPSRHVASAAAGGKQIAMVKPATAPSHVDRGAVQTAGMPACVHYRSYNAASKSYLGYDGHMYACR